MLNKAVGRRTTKATPTTREMSDTHSQAARKWSARANAVAVAAAAAATEKEEEVALSIGGDAKQLGAAPPHHNFNKSS